MKRVLSWRWWGTFAPLLLLIVGLLPMALGLDVGSEANAPLARAVVGGLVLSTGLTLFFLPVLYTAVEERFPRRKTEELL